MDSKQLIDRITTNPEVMVGKPTIRGLRITVEQILKALAGNVTVQDLLEDYPELEFEDIKAVLLYAAELVSEEQVFEKGNLESQLAAMASDPEIQAELHEINCEFVVTEADGLENG